jgi:hypothetical protein
MGGVDGAGINKTADMVVEMISMTFACEDSRISCVWRVATTLTTCSWPRTSLALTDGVTAGDVSLVTTTLVDPEFAGGRA